MNSAIAPGSSRKSLFFIEIECPKTSTSQSSDCFMTLDSGSIEKVQFLTGLLAITRRFVVFDRSIIKLDHAIGNVKIMIIVTDHKNGFSLTF